MSHDVEGGAQRDAGDDAGQRDRQDEEQRDRLAPEEAGARQRRGCKRAEDERQQRRDGRDLERQIERRPDVGPRAPGDAEPVRGQARRRKLKALLLGGEGVENDERQRQMKEQQPGDRRRCASPRAKPCSRQRTSKAPMRFAIQR